MGLTVHAGNDLEALSERLIAALSADQTISDPAELYHEQRILVPTAGLRDWLRQRIADRLGICGGIQFLFPGQLVSALCAATGLPDAAWDADLARWTCLRLIADRPALRDYLGPSPGSARGYSLARAIIDCFERYALYRPDETLAPWARAEPGPLDELAAWQPALWRELLAAGLADPVTAHAELANRLANGQAELPPRLHAFGFNTLAPELLRLLGALGRAHAVEIHCFQPTWGYWDDQRPRRELLRSDLPATEWGNRLLGDWGLVGRQFLAALDTVEATYLADPDDFRDPGAGCLLHRLQRDVTAAQAPQDDGPFALAADDRSLQVHACYGLRRQLEVAKAAIHEACAADPSLRPHDVALMCPDPAQVAPVAHAVFTSDGYGPPIAVSIADRTPRTLNPSADVLLRLLDLLSGRFTAGEVTDFIGTAAVSAAWGLGADELDILRAWIDRADLRWGVDAEHRRATVGHAYAAGSWLRGLQRLLLGWWFGPDSDQATPYRAGDDPAEAVVPVADFQPEEFECLKRISMLLQPILSLAEEARSPHPAGWWRDRLTDLLGEVLVPSDDDPDFAAVVAEIAAWAQVVEHSGWTGELDTELLAADFADRFSIAQGGDFGRGALTICGMQPMRSVPFRMLCLVGMDDGAFPREHRHRDFDLLSRSPRSGDRDLRQDDRYLMLELVLSVRDRLCITYQGHDPRDRTPLPPASLVGEFLDAAAQTCGLPVAELAQRGIHQDHPLHGSMASGPVWPSTLVAAEHAALTGPREPDRFEAVTLPAPDLAVVSIEDLVGFWRSPARSYLRRLGIRVAEEVEPPRDHERFATPQGLDRYAAAMRLLSSSRAPEDLRDRLAAEGWLPPGALGQHAWERLSTFVEDLRDRQDQVFAACAPWSTSITHDGLRIAAEFEQLHPQRGLIQIHPGRESEGRHLDLYIRCVVAAVAGAPATATLYHLESKGRVTELTLQVDDPEACLAALVAGYRRGQQDLLPFALRTSREYAYQRWFARRTVGRLVATAKAADKWRFTAPVAHTPPPEMAQPAHQIAWPPPTDPTMHDDFPDWADRIWKPALAAARGAP